MGYDHIHRSSKNLRRLGWTLLLVVLYMAAEVVGGILTNSLALLADASHMLSDAGALGLCIFAIWIASRPASADRTFGYYRSEILAALINGAALVAIAVFILIEAWQRLREPQEVAGPLMLVIAVGGLVVNLVGLAILRGGRHESLNIRGAWLHVFTDTLGSLQVIAAAALISIFGWNWIDPVASALIALLVLWSSWSLLKEAVDVLLESSPSHIAVEEVREAIQEVPGVRGVHDLHVWTITSGFESLSAHVVVADERPSILTQIQSVIRERFGLEHITLQLEPESLYQDAEQEPSCVCAPTADAHHG